MTKRKKSAIKRTRPLKSDNHNKYIIAFSSIGSLILVVVLFSVYFFVIRDNDKDIEKKDETEQIVNSEQSNEIIGPSNNAVDSVINTIKNEQNKIVNSLNNDENTRKNIQSDQLTATPSVEVETSQLNQAIRKKIEGMELTEKIDYLFALTPVSLVNSTIEDENEKFSKVTFFGETTKKSYDTYKIGGIIVGDTNTETNADVLMELIDNIKEYSESVNNIPVLICMDEQEYQKLYGDNLNTSENSFVPDILISDNNVQLRDGLEIQVEIVTDQIDAEEAIELLNSGTDMILCTSDSFDYKNLREKIVSKINLSNKISKQTLNKKLAKIMSNLENSSNSTDLSEESSSSSNMDENDTSVNYENDVQENAIQENTTNENIGGIENKIPENNIGTDFE